MTLRHGNATRHLLPHVPPESAECVIILNGNASCARVLHNARLIIHGSETRMEIKPEEIFPIWKLPRMLAAEYTPFYIKLSSDLAY